jgi:PAS domain-containing protein
MHFGKVRNGIEKRPPTRSSPSMKEASVLFANNSAEEILGYTIPELLGRELTSGTTLMSSSLDSGHPEEP